jgi:dTDP-4-dehydrorhamnose 3,5-epimerase
MPDRIDDPGVDHVAAAAAAARRDEPTVKRDGSARSAPIEGVAVQRTRVYGDQRGALIPFMDLREPFWSEPVVYGYFITVRPGRIKGWGMHELQADRYFVAGAHLRVALFDGREQSPTRGNVHEIHFTPETPGLVRIPPGVWHADQNWGERDAIIVNYPTRAYDPDAPDKYRIDPHSGVIPFDWTVRDG